MEMHVLLAELLNEGKGSEVIAFMDYLETPWVPKRLRSQYEALGLNLFKRSYTFGYDLDSPWFVKRDELSSFNFPDENRTKLQKGLIYVSYDWLEDKGPTASMSPYPISALQTDKQINDAMKLVKDWGMKKVKK